MTKENPITRRGPGRSVWTLTLALALLAPAVLANTTWTFDANTSTTHPWDGTRTVRANNSSYSYWWTGSGDTKWPASPSPTYSMIIGAGTGNGTAGTITVGNILDVNTIQFNTTGDGGNYLLSGSGTLSMDGTSPGITFGATGLAPKINCIIGQYSAGTVVSFGGGSIPGTLTLGGANAFTGSAVLDQITVNFNSLQNGGTASSFGAGNNTVPVIVCQSASSSAVNYTGTGGSTDRPWQVGGPAGANSINNNGSGAIAFNNTGAAVSGTAGPRNLTLGGTYTASANTFAELINDLGTTPNITTLTVNGGIWTLTGANTYSGSTTVSAGTLVLGASGSLASPTINVAANAVFDVSGFSPFTLSGSQTLTGSGSVNGSVNANPGAQIIPGGAGVAGTLTFSNNLTLDGQSLTFGLSPVPTSGNDQINVGGTLTLSANTTINVTELSGSLAPGIYTLMNYAALATNSYSFIFPPSRGLALNVGSTSLTLVVGGGGGGYALAWVGDGAANNWDIQTTTNWLNAGNLDFFYEADSVTFDDTGSDLPAVNLTAALFPSGVLVNAAKSYTFSGPGQLAGPMTLTKNGAGTLFLRTTNTYTGGTTVSNGTLELDTANGAGTGAINLGANILTVNIAGGTLPNAVNGSGAINVTETASATTTLGGSLANFTGVINLPASPGGTTAKAAITSAAVNLNSNATVNIASGGTLYLSGVTVGASNNVAGTGNGDNLGALRVDGGSTISGPVNLLGNTTIGENGSGRGAISGVISDGGSGYGITKVGGSTSTLTLAGANTYSGGTTLSAGQLNLNNASALGTGTFTIAADGCSFDNTSGADIEVANAFALSGGSPTYVGSANNMIIDGAVTLSGANRTITVTANALTLNGAIDDSGAGLSLTKAGEGTLTLGNANTYTGGTIISAGRLQIGRFYNLVGAVTQSGDGQLYVSGSSQTIANNFSLSTKGDGYYGAICMYAGQITLSGTLTLNGPTRIGMHNTMSEHISGQITGSGPIDFFGQDNANNNHQYFTLSNPLNDYTGNTIITNLDNGSHTTCSTVLQTIANGVIPSGAGDGNVVFYGTDANHLAVLDLCGTTQSINGFTVSGPAAGALIDNSTAGTTGSLTVGTNNTTSAFSGVIQNTGGTLALTKIGTGTLTLSGANTYSDVTTVSGGTLLVNGDASGAANTVTVASSATLGGVGTIGGPVSFDAGSHAVFTNGATLTLNDSLIIAASGAIPDVHLNLSSNLVAGTYTLATYNPSDSSGAFNPTPVIDTGSFAAGTTNYITTAGGQVNLVVSDVTLYPPVLSGITMSGGAIILGFSGTNGQTWEILTSTNVATPLANWEVVTNGTFSGVPVNYTNSSIAEPQRYYNITSP